MGEARVKGPENHEESVGQHLRRGVTSRGPLAVTQYMMGTRKRVRDERRKASSSPASIKQQV